MKIIYGLIFILLTSATITSKPILEIKDADYVYDTIAKQYQTFQLNKSGMGPDLVYTKNGKAYIYDIDVPCKDVYNNTRLIEEEYLVEIQWEGDNSHCYGTLPQY